MTEEAKPVSETVGWIILIVLLVIIAGFFIYAFRYKIRDFFENFPNFGLILSLI